MHLPHSAISVGTRSLYHLLEVRVEACIEPSREPNPWVLEEAIARAVRAGPPDLPQELGQATVRPRRPFQRYRTVVFVDNHESAHHVEGTVVRGLFFLGGPRKKNEQTPSGEKKTVTTTFSPFRVPFFFHLLNVSGDLDLRETCGKPKQALVATHCSYLLVVVGLEIYIFDYRRDMPS